jgi:hypothetical protein
VRWISTVALQANLQGEDGVGEGANGSEGVRTHGRGGTYAWLGGCVCLVEERARLVGGRVRLLGGRARLGGDTHAWGGGYAHLGGEVRMPSGRVRTPGGGAHAWGGGCARLVERGHMSREGACIPVEGGVYAWWEGHARLGGGAHSWKGGHTRLGRHALDPQGA